MRPFRLCVVTALLLVAALTSGCAFAVEGRAVAAPQVTAGVDPGFIQGNDRGEDDRLAAAALTDLQRFWGATFPSISGGRGFEDLAGYFSVDSSRPGPPPPCLDSTIDIEGNAYYCPPTDVLGYDRAALLPALRQDFGDTAVVVVLAHEFGHAIQKRLGVDSGGPGDGAAIPTILSEGQADCYAGLFLRQIRDGRTPDLRTDRKGIDSAMAALVTFRDPVGTGAADAEAHGNAFDRVSSFQLGFDGTATACAGMDTQNRRFSQTTFTSLRDQSNLGNLPMNELLQAMGPDLDRFFGGLVRARSRPWTPPAVRAGPTSCDGAGDEAQGPIAFCPAAGGPPALRVDAAGELAGLHRSVGDYATGTLLASRYGMAAVAALGMPTEGAESGRRALCLAGAYTGAVGDPGSGFGLSPGDLDESVQLLLRSDRPTTDVAGLPGAGTAYERIRIFRQGVSRGADACMGKV